MKKIMIAISLILSTPAFAGIPPVSVSLQNMNADATAVNNANSTAQALVYASNSYKKSFSKYIYSAMEGPIASASLDQPNSIPGVVLCPNPLWNRIGKPLAISALNMAGDAEALGYGLETVSVNWDQDIIYLMEDNYIKNTDNMQADKQLSSTLMIAGNQISDAMNPQTSKLVHLPFNQTVGIGNIYLPPSSFSQTGEHVQGLGWLTLPEICYPDLKNDPCDPVVAPVPDVCSVESASMQNLDILSMSQNLLNRTMVDAPDLQPTLKPLEGGSMLNIPQQTICATNDSSYCFSAPNFSARVQLMNAINHDVSNIGQYISPVTTSLNNFNVTVQGITHEVNK